MVTLVVHILLYIHAATVPQNAQSFFIAFTLCYLLGRSYSGSIICTSWAPAMGDALINLLNKLIY